MTQNYTPITNGAPANAAVINAPMDQLDDAIGAAVTTLTTTAKTCVGGINELDAQIGAAASVSGTIGTSIDTDGTLKAGAVDVPAVFANGVVTEDKIANGAVTDAKLAADCKVGTLAALTTDHKANTVVAINEINTNADAVTAEVVAARFGEPSLSDKIASIALAGGNIATLANNTPGAHNAAGQKVICVNDTTGFLAGARIAYTLAGGSLEYNVIDTVDSMSQMTATTNIGTGGILDNCYLSMIGESEYLAAQAINHAGALTLPLTMRYAANNIYNVLAYGAVGDGVTDDSAAIQAAVDATGTNGGIIYGPAGYTFLLNTAPIKIPKSVTGQLTFSFYGATIKCTATAPYAFVFNYTADHDIFQNWTLEGMTVDQDNVAHVGHVLIGTYGMGVTYARVNVKHFCIRDVTTINVPVSSSIATNHCLNINIAVTHAAAGETQDVIQDGFIENVRMEGGNSGIAIAGGGAAVTGLAIDISDITISHCSHNMGVVPTSNYASSHFHVGSRATGKNCIIENCYGYGSADVGVEVNSMDNSIVRNCTMEEVYGYAFYHTNYNNPTNADQQLVTFENCRVVRKTSASGWGFIFNNNLSVALGTIVIKNCSFLHNQATTLNTGGEALATTGATIFKRLSVDGFIATVEGWSKSYADPGAMAPIYLVGSTGTTIVDLRNISVTFTGTKTGAGYIEADGMYISGFSNLILNIDNIWLNQAVTGADIEFGIHIGAAATTIASATITRVTPVVMATGNGIAITKDGELTITDSIDISYCNFSAMVSGTEIVRTTGSGTTNAAKLHIHDNVWKTHPAPAATISVGASPDVYQNLDLYPENVIISGGTVSKIEISVDNSVFVDTVLTAGIFYLDIGSALRITHAGAPTAIKVPVK